MDLFTQNLHFTKAADVLHKYKGRNTYIYMYLCVCVQIAMKFIHLVEFNTGPF